MAREHIGRGPGGHDFADEQVVGLLVVRLGQHLAFQPAQAARDQRRADLAGGKVARPLAWNLSSSRPESVPTFSVARACSRDGMHSANSPEASISVRVWVFLSTTTSMRAGLKSSGMAQAAAMTLRRSPWALVTSTVGPWFSSR